MAKRNTKQKIMKSDEEEEYAHYLGEQFRLGCVPTQLQARGGNA